MAGIGFKLRRMVDQGTFAGFLQGYLYSAIISAGPWLISIATLAAIAHIAGGTSLEFSTAIVYVYSFTLIFVGPFQFTVTRYVSDRLYVGDTRSHIPAFLTTWCVSVLPQVVFYMIFMVLLRAPIMFRLPGACLYAIVASTWVVLIFLGVVRAYRLVITSFLVGAVTSVGTIMIFRATSREVSDAALLFAYSAGQAVVLLVLLWVLFAEFDFDRLWDTEVLRYLGRYPWLTLAGLTYYGGMWVDKIIYRFSEAGHTVYYPYFSAAPRYETAAFLAQLTAIPALAIFFLRVETEFFDRFREFYSSLQNKGSLERIERARDDMFRSLRTGSEKLLTVQGMLTLIFILLTPTLFGHLSLDAATVALVRLQMVAVFFQTLLFMICVVMMYYELHAEACATMSAFMVGNIVLTLVLLPLGTAWHGVGYLAAAVSSAGFGALLLQRRLQRLEFMTFVRQPIANLVTLPPERINVPGAVGEYTFVREGP